MAKLTVSRKGQMCCCDARACRAHTCKPSEDHQALDRCAVILCSVTTYHSPLSPSFHSFHSLIKRSQSPRLCVKFRCWMFETLELRSPTSALKHASTYFINAKTLRIFRTLCAVLFQRARSCACAWDLSRGRVPGGINRAEWGDYRNTFL